MKSPEPETVMAVGVMLGFLCVLLVLLSSIAQGLWP